MHQVSKLKSKLAELRSQLVESLHPESPAGRSEAEECLQEKAQLLQKELEMLLGQLHAQGQDNKSLSCMNQEQEERMLTLERAAKI
jgi:hypothetical protein